MSNMTKDRPRRPGEDVLAYALETGRVTAKSAPGWAARLEAGEVDEAFVEGLFALEGMPLDQPAAPPLTAQDVAYYSIWPEEDPRRPPRTADDEEYERFPQRFPELYPRAS